MSLRRHGGGGGGGDDGRGRWKEKKLSDEEEELQMVQRQRLQSLSLHHRIGDRSGAAGLAATLQMMAGVGDAA